MLFLMFLLLLSSAPYAESENAGTVLFTHNLHRQCWNQDEVAKLQARKIFEGLMLPPVAPDKIDRKYVKDALKYLRSAVKYAKDADQINSEILKEAVADTIGGHLRREILPSVKFAYYAGYIPFADAQKFHNLYEDMKSILNTKGIGWRPPAKVPLQSNLTVGKILIGLGKFSEPCASLVLRRDANQCIHLPIPRLDSESNPSAIALPFRSGGLLSLSSPNSENILLNYYTTASRCILDGSPENCRHSDFVTFNSELWHWMKRSVAPHLADERLFPALGGVLRVAAAVQNYGKGLSRRNLIMMDDFDHLSYGWHPWRSLTQSGVYINAEWTPKLYIGIIIFIGLLMCIVQFSYDRICIQRQGCTCLGRRPNSGSPLLMDMNREPTEMSYNVSTSFAALLPTKYGRQGSTKGDKKSDHADSAPKSKSLGTLQRVYDLNENKEKIMSIITSDASIIDIESPSSSSSEEGAMEKTVIDMRMPAKAPGSSRSPPRIEAAVAQLKIDKSSCTNARRARTYSSDTATETTFCQSRKMSDTCWSKSSSSSSSSQSATATTRTSLKSHSNALRDLAWVRRVASKHSRPASATLTTTECNSCIGSTSYTTPRSRRQC